MFKIVGGKEASLLELLLTIHSMVATPYGVGGEEVLVVEFKYDRYEIMFSIAREIGFSREVLEWLD